VGRVVRPVSLRDVRRADVVAVYRFAAASVVEEAGENGTAGTGIV
jgi:hypothetical protein